MIILLVWIGYDDCGIGLLDPQFPALKRRQTLTDWQRFEKVGSFHRPGLAKGEFMGLFVQCDVCKLIVMHRSFYDHSCEP